MPYIFPGRIVKTDWALSVEQIAAHHEEQGNGHYRCHIQALCHGIFIKAHLCMEAHYSQHRYNLDEVNG